MRLFIALELAENIKDEMEQAQRQLRLESRNSRFVRREHMHLTLVFLGEVDAADAVQKIIRCMDEISIHPFILSVQSAGEFRRQNGNICYASVKREPALMQLQSKLEKLLRCEKFAIDTRPYRPHLTLARNVLLEKPFVYDLKAQMRVDTMVLLHSHQENGRLVYTPIYRKYFV